MGKVINLGDKSSLASQYLANLRSLTSQADRGHFRGWLEQLGQIAAYEVSKTLKSKSIDVKTPLGISQMSVPDSSPAVVGILRAALPLVNGILNFFPAADCGFIGAYRKEGEGDIEVALEYQAIPDFKGKDLIIADPMLATGSSMVKAYDVLKKYGAPRDLHIVSVIASEQGVATITKDIPEATVWVFGIDSKLNENFFIVPGLGDAGDLSYGNKV